MRASASSSDISLPSIHVRDQAGELSLRFSSHDLLARAVTDHSHRSCTAFFEVAFSLQDEHGTSQFRGLSESFETYVNTPFFLL